MNPDVEKDLHFPAAGVDLTRAFWRQPNRPVGPQNTLYARTTPRGLNVRGYGPSDGRLRGGSRPGLSKYVAAAPVAGWLIQDLRTLVTSGISPPGGGVAQPSQSGRVVTLVAVSQGDVYVVNPGDTAWTAATNATGESPPLNFTGLMQSAPNNQKLWFVDGTNYVYYQPNTNTVYPWTASAGTLPRDDDDNGARLVCTWRGRTVLSGLLLDPQNWFMSAVSDPTDFDYSPVSQTPTQAVAGNNAPMGLIGDVVTGMVPYSNDVLIFGGDSSIYMMRGDPLAGGQIDLVTRAVGMAWGQAWEQDPYGAVYFLSNRTGIYRYVPGARPERISQAVEPQLRAIDTGRYGVRLLWNDAQQGLHVFVTPLAAPASSTHLFWEQRTGAWWNDRFADANFDPLCCCTFDGNLPTDRVALIGSWDGYVRAVDADATDDDGTAISSSVVIGPLVTPTTDDLLLKEIQAVLGETSGTVSWAVYVGTSAEAALSSTAVATGTFSAGRGPTQAVRRAGHAVYLKLTATTAWAMEVVRTRVAGLGKVRRRTPS